MTQTIRLVLGDCAKAMASLPEGEVGGIVCDPPYGLEFMGASWDKLDNARTWQGPGFSDTGIGERAIPWPSFSGATENPTCAVCGGRLRGAKKCSCSQPHDHWKPVGPQRFTRGGSERFKDSELPTFNGSSPNRICRKCKGTERGKDRKGFHRCRCEEPDFAEPRKRIPRHEGAGQASYGFSPGAPAQPGVRGEIKALPNYNASGNVQCRICGKWKWGHKEGDTGGGGKACSCDQPEFRNIKLEQAQGMALWHEVWLREAYRVLSPGGVVQAFGGTRTYHRLVQAMTAAGFRVVGLRAWQHGQGFPKSLAVDKALDKSAGSDPQIEKSIQEYLRTQRELLGLSKAQVDEAVFGGTTRYSWVEGRGGERADETYLPTPDEWQRLKTVLRLDDRYDDYIQSAVPNRADRARADGGKAVQIGEVGGDWGYQSDGDRWDGMRKVTTPATDLAKRYAGFGTALKPAFEPIVVGIKPGGDSPLPSCLSRVITLARKPLSGNVAQTVQRWGTGGLNIDGCRVGTEQIASHGGGDNTVLRTYGAGKGFPAVALGANPHRGRYPANLILQHDPACKRVGTAEAPGYAINRWDDGSKPFGGGAGHSFTSTEVPPSRVDVWECVAGCPVRHLDAQGGVHPGMSGGGARDNEKKASWVIQPFNRQVVRDEWVRGDTGGASRFFHQVQVKPCA